MSLLQSMERQGNFLFKYRGQFPLILFILAIPFIYYHSRIGEEIETYFMYTSITLSAIGFLIRFYTIGTTPKGTSGRNTKKQIATVLNSTGMYSLLRHPLYLGNYLIWIGIAGATLNIYFVIIISLLFWLYYERIIFAEEQFLKSKFGETYLNWSNTLPAFIPKLSNFKKSNTPFSLISVLRREYASVLSATIGFAYVEVLKNYIINGSLVINKLDSTLKILSIVIVVVIVLRSLKHHTNLLNEKGRS